MTILLGVLPILPGTPLRAPRVVPDRRLFAFETSGKNRPPSPTDWPSTLALAGHCFIISGRRHRRHDDSFVERLNLSLRQRVAAIRRRSATSCKSDAGLGQPLALFQAYYNFVLPHASLRQPLPVPEVSTGGGSPKVGRPCTPAMAAGLTDHVWSLQEVLLYRVPPRPQPQLV